MMWRVAVSSKTSSFASGGSPIHSTDCVNHGFGGFSTYCIKQKLIYGCYCHRLDRDERNKHLLTRRAGSLCQTNIIVRHLDDTPGIDPARHSLHVHYLSLEAAKKILNVLSRHFVTPFLYSRSQRSSDTCQDPRSSQTDRPNLHPPAAPRPLHARSDHRKTDRHLQPRGRSERHARVATSFRDFARA